MILSLLYLLLLRVLGVFRSDERAAAEAELENAVLRHQIAILRRQAKGLRGCQSVLPMLRSFHEDRGERDAGH